MYKLGKLIVLLLSIGNLLAADPKPPPPKPCAAVLNDCSFYQCLETKKPCGASGYAIGYGKFYCEQFKLNRSKFSAKGQAWLTSVMFCLQKALTPIANDNKPKSCPGIKSFAFTSHPKCYTQSGSSICDIAIADWLQLVVIIRRNLLDKETWTQMLEVAKTCGSQYFNAVLAAVKGK